MAEHWQKYSFRPGTRTQGTRSDEVLRQNFELIDRDGSGFIDRSELALAVQFWALNTGEGEPPVEQMLEFADMDGDNRISFDEFKKVMKFVPPPDYVKKPCGGGGASLQESFGQFCSFGSASAQTELDNAKWAKLCKDSGLIDKKFTKADMDMTFVKVVPKGKRKMAYSEFVEALRLVATKKGVSSEEVSAMVAAAAPSSSGTRADTDSVVTHFTDTTKYTGAHKHRFDEKGQGKGLAGRDSVAKGGGSAPGTGLASLADRSPADVRGVKY